MSSVWSVVLETLLSCYVGASFLCNKYFMCSPWSASLQGQIRKLSPFNIRMSTQRTMRIIFKILCEFFDSVIYCNLVCFTISFQIYIPALHFEPFKRKGVLNSTSSSLSYYNLLYNDIFFWADCNTIFKLFITF